MHGDQRYGKWWRSGGRRGAHRKEGKTAILVLTTVGARREGFTDGEVRGGGEMQLTAAQAFQ